MHGLRHNSNILLPLNHLLNPVDVKNAFLSLAALARVPHRIVDKFQDGQLANAAGLEAELPKGRLDRDFPFQVAFPTESSVRSANDLLIKMFCDHRNVAPRYHTVQRDGKDFLVYGFAEPHHAALFRTAFGGKPFNPFERKHGKMPAAAELAFRPKATA